MIGSSMYSKPEKCFKTATNPRRPVHAVLGGRLCSDSMGFYHCLQVSEISGKLSLTQPHEKGPSQLKPAAWLCFSEHDDSCSSRSRLVDELNFKWHGAGGTFLCDFSVRLILSID